MARSFSLSSVLLVLVARHALEPAERRDHRQQQVQLGVLGHLRLHEQRGHARIEPGRQPVDEHLVDEFGELLGVFVARGQGMPVRDEEKALVLVLEIDPVFECAMVVAKMQLTRRPHPGKNSFGLRMTAHGSGAVYGADRFVFEKMWGSADATAMADPFCCRGLPPLKFPAFPVAHDQSW